MILQMVPLSEIAISDRARKDFGEIGELAESIKANGLISPLVIDEGKRLIAGERRLRALTLLGWEKAPCVTFNTLNELERASIELHENTKRKDFSWVEEVQLTEKVIQLRKELDPSFTVKDDFLKEIDKSQTAVTNNLFLAKAIKQNPELALEKDKDNAFRKAKRLQDIAVRKLILNASGDFDLLPLETSPVGVRKFSLGGVTLYNQDCLEGIKSLRDESIDLIITDFPFGVELGENADFNKVWGESYPDSTVNLLNGLLPELAKEFKRVLVNGGHFYIFYPSIFQSEFVKELSSHFTIQKVPLIWDKRFGGTSFAPYTYYSPNFEPILYGWKGEPRKLKSPGYCVLHFDNIQGGKKTHPAEKPIDLISYLIDQSSIEGETVLETFSGSGVTLDACLRMNRRGVGFELSEKWFELAVERLVNKHQGGGEEK